MAGGKEVCKSEAGVDTNRGVKPFTGVVLACVIPRRVLSPKQYSSPKRLLLTPLGFIPVTCPNRLAVVFSRNGC